MERPAIHSNPTTKVINILSRSSSVVDRLTDDGVPNPRSADEFKRSKMGKIEVLSDASMTYLKLGINISYMCGSSPYHWNERTGRVEFNPSGKRYLIWAVHNLVFSGYLVFCAVRWVQYAFILESPSSPRAIGTFYIMTTYWINMASQYSLLRFYGEHHNWINNVLDFLKTVQRTQEHNLEKLHDGYKTCAWFMRVAMLVYILDTFSCAALPEAPFFISSMMPNPKGMSWLQQSPFVGFHVYIWMHQWASMFFHINTLVPYLTGLKNALNILRFGTVKGTFGPAPIKSMVVTSNFTTYFIQMAVLNTVANKLWSTANAILEVAMLFGCIIACYGTVRLDASRALHQGAVVVLLGGTVLVIWGIMGELFEVSKGVRESWAKMRGNPLFRKYYKAARPLRVNIGQGLFFADRGIKLTLLEVITTNVSSLLLGTSGSKGSLA